MTCPDCAARDCAWIQEQLDRMPATLRRSDDTRALTAFCPEGMDIDRFRVAVDAWRETFRNHDLERIHQ